MRLSRDRREGALSAAGGVVVVRAWSYDDVARSGEDCPEQEREPADASPTEEKVEQQDSGDVVTAVGGYDCGHEIEQGESGKGKHTGGLQAAGVIAHTGAEMFRSAL